MKRYLFFWSGQFVSMLGTALTGYGLAFWFLETQDEVTAYSMIGFAVSAPSILLTPFLGVLVDRFPRKKILFAGHAGAGLCSLMVLMLFFSENMKIMLLVPAIIVSSILNAMIRPAFTAVTSLMVDKEQLGRASGIMGFGNAVVLLLVPPLAAFLLGSVQLLGILLIDVCTFLYALTIIMMSQIPDPTRQLSTRLTTITEELKTGWSFIVSRRPLVELIAIVWFTSLGIGMVNVLFPPLILSFATTTDLATVLSFAGIGTLAGGVAMFAWGGPARKMTGVLLFAALFGVVLLLALLPFSIAILSFAAAVAMFSQSIASSCGQVIWQKKVPPHLQGRVFSLATTIGFSSIPIAYLCAGPLADNVFEPFLNQPHDMPWIALIIGTGKGRGIALMLALIGVMMVCLAVAGWFRRNVRDAENILADEI